MNWKRILLLPLVFLLPVFFICPSGVLAGTFKDVPPGGAYTPYITFLSETGILKGYPDGTFRPGNSLTRAEAVTALSIAGKIAPSGTESVFTDVTQEHWAAGFINAGVQSGILKGYSDGTFRPDNTVTRAELAALLVNLSGIAEALSPGAVTYIPTGHWADGVIGAAIKEGFFLYSSGESFNPDNAAFREVLARGTALAVTSSPKLNAVTLTGTISPVGGQVWLTTQGNENILENGSPITSGNVVRTGAEGEAEILFADGTGFLVKPNTYMIITRAKGRVAIKSDGKPVNITEEMEIKLDSGKIIGSSVLRQEEGPVKTALLDRKPIMMASASRDHYIIADALNQDQPGQGSVRVVTPFGTIRANGFWINEVSTSGQTTTALTRAITVTSNGVAVQVKPGQSSQTTSASAPPGTPRAMTSLEAAQWVQDQKWVTEQAVKISKLDLVSIIGSPAANQSGLVDTVNKSISTAQNTATTKPAAAVGPSGPSGPSVGTAITPSIVYSMNYTPIADGYKVNIYLNSLANATYIEYTFEFDNTKLSAVALTPDLIGILTAFAGQEDLDIGDIAIDSGWIINGGKTYRTIQTKQFETEKALNYSGSPAHLLSINMKRLSPGATNIVIKNIRVSYGSTSKSMSNVTLSIP